MEPVLVLADIPAPVAFIGVILGLIIAIPVGVLAVIYLIVPFFKALGWIIKQIGVFLFSTVADILRLVGTVVTSIVLIPLTVGNVIIGRWSASAHYGRAIQAEFKSAGKCVYRLMIGNPARLLCLTPLTEGLERRIPEVMAAAPGSDRPSKRLGQFAGYQIVGSLAGGGSGGRLYVAKPDAQKLAAFARNGHSNVDQVVIKCFAQGDGTTLPQIVRENRALDAAKKLGLILEHDLNNERFFYVMRYVPGDSLNLVTQRLHAAAGGSGLGRRETHEVLSYVSDLLTTLRSYHEGGLWHKDVKPDNVIVSAGHAHLVDFGLVTPLRSAMTLTTHGTEYFRDPEMVRMALKGVKVHEVDGAKFDLYAVGAVLFSLVENSFPAHGGLSQITRPCPEAVRWIVRRAMTDYDKRYESAAAMLADVQAVLRSADPYALRPAHLPSVAAHAEFDEAPVAAAPTIMPPPIPQPAAAPAHGGWAYPGMNPHVAAARAAGSPSVMERTPSGRIKPDIRVTGWFSGRYAHQNARQTPHGGSPFAAINAAANAAAQAVGAASVGSFVPHPPVPPMPPAAPFAAAPAAVHRARRSPAAEQLKNARTRAAAARERVRTRMSGRQQNFPAGVNAGIVVAVLVFLALFGVAIVSMLQFRQRAVFVHAEEVAAPPLPIPEEGLPVLAEWSTIIPANAVVKTNPEETNILVVCEWSRFDDIRQQIVTTQMEHLTDEGFLLTGDYVPAFEEDVFFDQEAKSLVAEVRAAVGTRLYMTPDARDIIRQWLDKRTDVDMVLWMDRSVPGRADMPGNAWLIGSSTAGQNLVGDAANILRSANR